MLRHSDTISTHQNNFTVARHDGLAEFNLLLGGWILRINRRVGTHQRDDLEKLLEFVSRLPQVFIQEVYAVLADFDRETGVWRFVDSKVAQGNLSCSDIATRIRRRIEMSRSQNPPA